LPTSWVASAQAEKLPIADHRPDNVSGDLTPETAICFTVRRTYASGDGFLPHRENRLNNCMTLILKGLISVDP
jgi:hypothetical protein